MRQIVLDTETTGLDPQDGHRIIEIGCVELIDRRLTGNNFHRYIQPDREIDAGAVDVHGITTAFLADKPRFAEVAEVLLRYLEGAELIIHNAAFDVGFLDYELSRWRDGAPRVSDLCEVTDTLAMARRLHPGQRNSLDALCKRYAVDNRHRDLHGALLDAEILADVYLAMTGGQVAFCLGGEPSADPAQGAERRHRGRIDPNRPPLPIVRAEPQALAAHAERLRAIQEASPEGCVWLRMMVRNGLEAE
ncbi:MAG: DNA polymerase III subunit epsilon [Thiocapsa sp.]|jgi:DNA polymerase-3 subunit epsilon|nr:DNA polymerase III subunit epsilon [Thiocapsa sp.]MCG6896162.1 DNA polymerase III subunit epsilon [Thiocapsa sp.]MCG6986265.1 DNA polymerase III subunit epsilon [Thiocapsa sp.]